MSAHDDNSTRRRGVVRLVIAGGGVGGLTLAASLASDERFDITVVERSRRALSGGAAIIVWGNAIAALRSIGMDRQVLDESVPLESTEFRNLRGATLCELPIGEWSSRSGSPTVVIRRAALIDALSSRVPAASLLTGIALLGFSSGGTEVGVELENNKRIFCDGLVGADGLRSRVRGKLLGVEEPRALPYEAWVGITRWSDGLELGRSVAWLGRGPRFWAARLTRGEAFWYATLNSTSQRVTSQKELLELLADWPRPVADLVASTQAGDLIRTQIADRLPSDRWGTGPVTLLGDAAHPATPDLGQGACQAIEGAVVLAACLKSFSSVTEAFREYERIRIPRTATISRLCALTWGSSSMESVLACRLRDHAMSLGFRAIARPQFEWLLRGQAYQP